MSNFNDNPFADPRQTNDPFGDSSDNPFAPPPAAGNRGDQSRVRSEVLDDFNPFDGSNAANKSQPTPPQPLSQPAVLPPNEPPPYSASAAQHLPTDELERRQRELEAKAADLQRREEEALRREELAKSHARGQQNNWPPLPGFMPCGPCFFQDIDLEIPIEFRAIVKIGYYMWIAHSGVLLLNIIGALAYFIGTSGSSEGGTTFGMSILFFILLTPCSFVCWFRPLYKAFRADSSFNFFMFFFVFFAQCVVLIIQCLGINWLASCGWINGIATVGKSPGAGAIMLIIAALFTILAVADGFLLIRVHRIYRSTGASFEKAKQEFSTGVMSSQAVRGAAADVGAGAVRGAVSGGYGGGTGGVRY